MLKCKYDRADLTESRWDVEKAAIESAKVCGKNDLEGKFAIFGGCSDECEIEGDGDFCIAPKFILHVNGVGRLTYETLPLPRASVVIPQKLNDGESGSRVFDNFEPALEYFLSFCAERAKQKVAL